jgi:hypothetical protein
MSVVRASCFNAPNPCHFWPRASLEGRMIRIAITAEAFEAVAAACRVLGA